MRKFKKDQRIEVFWLDADQNPKWQNEAQMNKPPDSLCVTLGYFYKYDKDFIYLSHTMSGKERDRTTIPLGVIKKIQIVRP